MSLRKARPLHNLISLFGMQNSQSLFGSSRTFLFNLRYEPCFEDPCSDSTALGHEQIGLELTAERLGPNGARRSQAAGLALAFAVQVFSTHADNKSETQAHTKGFVNDTIPKPLGSTRNIDQ